MRNKLVLIVLITGTTAVALIMAVAATFFAVVNSSSVQAEEATLDVVPVQVEPVQQQVVKPVQQIERVKYSYSDGGGCSGKHSAEQPLAKAPDTQVDESLLSLAEVEK